jgi:hypothetical protein
MACHLIYQKLLPHFRDHLVHSHDHLDEHLVRPLLPALLRQQIRQHLGHLDAHHQIHRDDLPLGEVRQSHLVLRPLHLGHLVLVRQIHLDVRRDLPLVDLDHLDEHLLVEVRQLRCHLVLVQRHLKKMDCYLRAGAAAQK